MDREGDQNIHSSQSSNKLGVSALNNQLLPQLKSDVLKQINRNIQDHQNASSLNYIQRAIVYYFQNQHQKAIQDLQKAAQIDPLNPTIYYNLATVQICQNLIKQALKNIYCGVSCLYLKRALVKQQQIDTHRALKNCPSNVDARILLGIYLIRDKKLYLALREIKSAIEMNPNSQSLYKIKDDIQKHLNMGGSDSLIKVQGQGRNQLQRKKRLIYQQKFSQEQPIVSQLNLKLKQYKQLYTQLYGETTKKSQKNMKIWILYNSNRSQKIVSQQEVLSQSQDQTLLLQSTQLINNLKSPRRISKDEINSQKIISNKMSKSTISFKKQQRQFDLGKTNMQFQTNLRQNCQPKSSQQKKPKRKLSNKSTSDKNNQHQEINDENMLKFVQINLIQCQFCIRKQTMQNMKSVYCIVILNSAQTKFNSKQVQVKASAIWNQTFEKQMQQIKLEKIKVKVYNKNLKSFRDDFIGQGEIQLPDFGSYKFPIYFKENKTGWVSLQIRKLLKKDEQMLL